MPDLSQYIALNAVLDNSGASPTIKIIDTSAYPAGIAQQIAGILSITQPDLVTISNPDFTHPDIAWSNGALTPAIKPLRLANNQRFQNGGYTVTYVVRCPGFADTTFSATFIVNYTAPTPVITQSFDNFTPKLVVTDATNYGAAGPTFVGVVQNWSGLIRSVLLANQPIVGAGLTFDLQFGGNYYDAAYDITLTSIVTYQIPGASPWVTLIDKVIPPTATYFTEIPPTLDQLLVLLTILKTQLDAAQNNGSAFQNLQTTYSYAVAIYEHLKARGRSGSLAGLSAYVYQLQMIFNNGVTPAYVNTNGTIPPYDWGAGSGSSTWNTITGKPSTFTISWAVGQGGYPGVGASSITDARLANVAPERILVLRNNQLESAVTKVTASTTLNFANAFSNTETIYILVLPL